MVGAHHRILMSDLIAFRNRELEKAAADFEARSEAARFAVANTVIEGGHVLPETEELMNERPQDRLTPACSSVSLTTTT
jgi:hypothetical protein